MTKTRVAKSKLTATRLWEQIKKEFGKDPLVVRCLIPFFPKKHKDIHAIIDLLLYKRFSMWEDRTLGILLCRNGDARALGILKKLAEQKRRASDTLFILRSVLRAHYRGEESCRTFWSFFSDYIQHLSVSDLQANMLIILEILEEFYNNSIPFRDIVQLVCKITFLITELRLVFLARFAEKFSTWVPQTEWDDNLSDLIALLKPHDRAIFLAPISSYVRTHHAASLLRETLEEMLRYPAYGNFYIECILEEFAGKLRGAIFWEEVADCVLKFISLVDRPEKRLQFLAKVGVFIPKAYESDVCEIVKATIRDPKYRKERSENRDDHSDQ